MLQLNSARSGSTGTGRRRGSSWTIAALAVAFLVAAPVHADWIAPEGVDLTRPRLLASAAEIETARQRVTREPYRSLLAGVVARAGDADSVPLDDDSINAHRRKSRAAKSLAFLYALDRTIAAGEVASLSELGQRQQVGDRVRDLLVNLFPRSRLAVPEPLGGWDRDISTSEELLQYAVAYDTMLGAGYDFGADEAVIVERLASLATELYDNFVNPSTASSFALLHWNNHRSKTGAALVAAAIALAEYEPQPGTDPRGVRDPAAWLDYGLDQLDLILRWVCVTGDGAYSEGPFYWRFNSQNVLPVARAWNRLLGGRPYTTRTGLEIADFQTHPLFERTARWMLDMTLPDGSLAPIDDGNPGRSYYFGLLPPMAGLERAFAWRWQNAPTPFDVDGNVDLGADAILFHDDEVVPEPPPGSPTAFYIEGGNAILRSSWNDDAVLALVLGEHDTASLFGRDRSGRGVGPQGHEHADPGAFLLHAYGERLLLDPGYLSFPERDAVSRPEHHNIILVDGEGPVDYTDATLRWVRRPGRPPADGHSTLSDPVDTGFGDAVRVTTRYGQPAARAALVQRRFVLLGHRTLVVADDVFGPSAPERTYSWMLHGNAGGASGGGFARTDDGAVWSRDKARVSSAIVFDSGVPAWTDALAVHEETNGERSSHVALRASVTGGVVRALQVLHPSPTDREAPRVAKLDVPGAIGIDVVDGADRLVALRSADGRSGVAFADIATDGTMLLLEGDGDGGWRTLWAEGATWVDRGGVRLLASDGLPDLLALSLGADAIEVVASGAAREVVLQGLPIGFAALDGGCAATGEDGAMRVSVVGDRHFALRRSDAGGRPAADAGSRRRVGVGEVVELDGTRSCATDGPVGAYRWKLVSAPAGSAWRLEDAGTATPRLHVDRAGPYRLRLAVAAAADPPGESAWSEETEVVLVAGERCSDGVDDDLDGLFDGDDPDCDAGAVCPGDCSGDGAVTVDEIIRAVDIALGQHPLAGCGSVDRDGSNTVTVDEIVISVDAALRGCPTG
jgi:hypothetical protein